MSYLVGEVLEQVLLSRLVSIVQDFEGYPMSPDSYQILGAPKSLGV